MKSPHLLDQMRLSATAGCVLISLHGLYSTCARQFAAEHVFTLKIYSVFFASSYLPHVTDLCKSFKLCDCSSSLLQSFTDPIQLVKVFDASISRCYLSFLEISRLNNLYEAIQHSIDYFLDNYGLCTKFEKC